MAKERYLEAGKIVNTHGVKGDVKIESWCDEPEVFGELSALYLRQGGEYRAYRLTRASTVKGMALCHLEGIDTLDDAVALRNRVVFADREEIPLPEGAVFMVDLIGLPVVDIDDGKVYGTIAEVQQGLASDLYEIKTETGTVLFPAVPEFVKEIDLDKGVFIRPIGGFFDAV